MKIYQKSSINWSNGFDLESANKELTIIEKDFESPDFWGNPEKAAALQKKANQLKEKNIFFKNLKEEFLEIKEISDLFKDSDDAREEIALKAESFERKIEEKSLELFLSGDYDQKSAIIEIKSGAGGRDAEDWATMLLRMYQRYAEIKDWGHKIISQNFTQGGGPDGRIGIKEAEIEIKGKFAFGYLKKESGAHRLVRLSPFSAKQLRHTSFAKVEVSPKIEDFEITESVLRSEDLKVETFRSSGAGGQNVNRRETAVRITHIPTGLVSSCQTERYQALNKKIALEILAGKVLRQKEEEKHKELARLKGEKIEADFGHQIRSYILHPYTLVKDHRTQIETANAQAVLNGEMEEFIKAEIKPF